MACLPSARHAARDRALLLFLYNTGARAQEVAELRVSNLDLGPPARVRLHGKGDKWRMCPLWAETARQLQLLLQQCDPSASPDDPVFVSRPGRPLTRFGIYKIVRRHCTGSRKGQVASPNKPVSPHTFRHTAAVHLLESGVEVNVIRGWLGHASLDTTNRYAEITLRIKEAAMRACEPPGRCRAERPTEGVVWRDDEHSSMAGILSDRYVPPAASCVLRWPRNFHSWPHNGPGHKTTTTAASRWPSSSAARRHADPGVPAAGEPLPV